ncbi:hypothetical protein Sked_03210 [Sanguibacter keddieii DSM 10542]|uniref:Lipoprotein n=1 Tax=Sanguibacter keddieii (strain ATCC 51767 / DSM 10542 / NCFB 3025 / ST-74) TaxID=446469 RepID=D1BJN3_SANKS|nr:hypothetical protein [Sanguibacter keddieii]ACZ20289.1 hypothetical protein Sked_03210 [Sanguibacter keddieii DSM 10542]
MTSGGTSRLLVAVSLGMVAAGGLAACSGSEPAYADLDAAQGVTRELPPVVSDSDDDAAAAGYRWVAEHDGVQLWIGAVEEDDMVCLAAYASDTEWVHACGGTGATPPQFGGRGVGTFFVVADGQDAPSGTVALSENVFVAE